MGWEYRILVVGVQGEEAIVRSALYGERKPLETALNELDAEGWELMGVASGRLLVYTLRRATKTAKQAGKSL